MSILARIEVKCNSEEHHISAWEPGDEEACGSEHVTYGPKGHIICYEDHDVELELTITDLTGEKCNCLLVKESLAALLLSGAGTGNFDRVAFSMYAGADIDCYEGSALVEAARRSHLDIVKLLVDNGANVTLNDNEAIINAASSNSIRSFKHIVKYGAGADVHAQHDRALTEASRNGYLGMVKLLLKYNPPRTSVQKAGNEALRYSRMNVFYFLKDHLQRMEWKEP
jgi:hypothetical protein